MSENTSAQNTVTGLISNGATWIETILITDQDGAQVTGVDTDTWQFQFRCDPESESADLTLSTTDGTLTITEGDTQTTLAINCPQSRLSGLEGDYVTDLVSKTVAGIITHRAHGTIVFRNDPIAF